MKNWVTCICRSAHQPTTIMGGTVSAMAATATVSFVSRRLQGARFGTTSSFGMDCGITTRPIEDRAVPVSKVPGERAALSQPFPTRPAPIDVQGLQEETLIDLTPELRKEALEIVSKYDYGPLFTPPSERGTIMVPGPLGGANWSGAAVDPETGLLYVSRYASLLSSPSAGQGRASVGMTTSG